MNDAINALLTPRSIAVIGASADFTKLSGRPIKTLIPRKFAGGIYPVNPKYQEIGGLPCYASVEAIPHPVDLAIIATPAETAAETIRALGRKGVKAAIVFASGFSE